MFEDTACPLLQIPPCSAFRGAPSILPLQGRESFPPLRISGILFFQAPRRGNAAGLTPSPARQSRVEPGAAFVAYLGGFFCGLKDSSPLLPLRGSVATPWSSWMSPEQRILSLLELLFPPGALGKAGVKRGSPHITRGRANTLLFRGKRGVTPISEPSWSISASITLCSHGFDVG